MGSPWKEGGGEGGPKVTRKGVEGRPGSQGGSLGTPRSFLSPSSICPSSLSLPCPVSVPLLSLTPPPFLPLPNSTPRSLSRCSPAAEGHRGAHQVGGTAPAPPGQLPEHDINSDDSWGPAPSRRGMEPARGWNWGRWARLCGSCLARDPGAVPLPRAPCLLGSSRGGR